MDAFAEPAMNETRNRKVTGAIKDYGRKLFGFIRGKVRTEEDAEDLMQDVWFQLSNYSGLDQIESVSSWLYRVAQNRITDYYRKKRRTSIEDFIYETEDGELSLSDILLPDEKDPDLKEFSRLFWDELMNALEELPEKQREVFILNELEEMTLQQIADKQGENLKTIISRKGYAVKFLKQKLEYLYNDLK